MHVPRHISHPVENVTCHEPRILFLERVASIIFVGVHVEVGPPVPEIHIFCIEDDRKADALSNQSLLSTECLWLGRIADPDFVVGRDGHKEPLEGARFQTPVLLDQRGAEPRTEIPPDFLVLERRRSCLW